MRRHRIIKREIIINEDDNIQNKFITEDDLINWVKFNNGLIMTRKINNNSSIDFNLVNMVCLTGKRRIINNFFNNYINKIDKKIKLILLEADNIDLTMDEIKHSKIEKIFMWNKKINHEKIICLPIGLNKERHINLLNLQVEKKEPRKLLLINYDSNSHGIRKTLLNKARKEWSNFAEIKNYFTLDKHYYINTFTEGKLGVGVTKDDYYLLIQDYKFILSPRGGGEDCHRTWEALYMGRIPIVISSSIEEIYEDLPVLVLKNWNEINEDFLNKKWLELKDKFNNVTKLSLNYWKEKIIGKKINFITYANKVFENSKKRILKEADNFGVFTSIKGYGPEDLDNDFSEKYKDILNMSRGGGYWIWRYHIIKKELNKLKENDILLFIDAGSKLNKKGMKRFNEYIEMLENSNFGILSFQMKDQIEKKWTTKEIFNYFNINLDSEIVNSGQYLGGILLMKKNKHCIDFVNYMLKILEKDRFLFTDKYNKNQMSCFKENRHDQYISSVYRKIHGSVVIPTDETFIFHSDRGKALYYPIWAIRSKT